MPRTRLGSLAALLAIALTPDGSARAAPFRHVWGMSADLLKAEPDASLCEAIAAARWRNLQFPGLGTEATRRKLDCSALITRVMGVCEPLRLTGKDLAQGRGMIYTVRNTSPFPLSFHINNRGIASTRFDIAARSEQRFGVSVPVGLGVAGQFINRKNPDVDNVIFFDCRVR